ncbi:MAG: hypothetical protein H0W08_13110 [Acidobacteria bacterium]|nr:hypothetical protein [Acidobacteriota bacterium]
MTKVQNGDGRIVPMTCAGCGMKMNPHAEKPVDPVTRADTERVDAAVSALIEEIHQCPDCGNVQSRRV